MLKYLLVLALSVTTFRVSAQLSGVVKDSQSGKTLEGATVFIHNTSISSTTSATGEFSLNGIAPGFADLVIYKEGYALFKSSVRIVIDKAFKLNLELTPAEKIKPVKVKSDAEFKENRLWFERAVLGTSTNASQTVITNPKALVFSREADKLIINFVEPLVIDNAGLGYRIFGYYQKVEAGVEDAVVTGWLRYDSLPQKAFKNSNDWERNRMKAFWGSDRHLFRSMVQGKIAENGFELINQQGAKISYDSVVKPAKMQGYFKVNLPGKSQVKYIHEDPELKLNNKSEGQVSWIEPLGNIEVSVDGIPFSQQALRVTGAMSLPKLADKLPLNFVPTSELDDEKADWKNFELLQEKLYLHTDRDYYYARENIWFKAYVGFSMPSLRDTLSKTLHVDLIAPNKKIIKTKTYRIRQGAAWGDFKLPDTLTAGQYYLRAYTNWMRNYGAHTFFVKQIPVLEGNQNIDIAQAVKLNESSTGLSIKPSADAFKARENVELNIKLEDASGKSIEGASLSVSVTDVVAAVPLSKTSILTPGILKPDPIAESQRKYFESIQFAMEKGLTMTGVVKDDKGNPVACALEIVQGKLENMVSLETDEKGRFAVAGLEFYDSTSFAFKASRKNRVYSKIEFDRPSIPPFEFNQAPLALQFRKENVLQRIQNTYNPEENVTLLEEVEVKGKRIDQQAAKGNVKVYGKADYTLNGNQIRSTAVGTNFLVGLQGKVPGLRVTETIGPNGTPQVSVKIRGGSSSLVGDTNPLFLVDGVPFPDANSLNALSPDMIDSVEIITRAVPQFGSRGTNGVISIFTKKGISSEPEKKDFIGKKIQGYSRPRPFSSPTYSGAKVEEPDFRTTIYWNPNVTTDKEGNAMVSFYTADLVGTYRIVVEGITPTGAPVRAEASIEVR